MSRARPSVGCGRSRPHPIGFLLLLAGCGPSRVGPANPAATNGARAVAPNLEASSALSLERLGRTLRVGDDERAFAEFNPRPPGAFAFSDLPTQLEGTYEARGWETSREAFGVLLYGGRVALAMRGFYGVDAPRFDDLLLNLRRASGRVAPTTLTGPNVDFWFWEDGERMLMLLRRRVRSGRYEVTEALGERNLMLALDMAPGKAKGIVERLESEETATPGPSAAAKGARP